MSKRAILYARHSTDHQNPKSSTDQLAACRAYTERKGYLVLAEFVDEAKTSASLHNRPGLDAVRAIAKRGQVQVLIVEELDRLSRAPADLHVLHRELEFEGVSIETCSGVEADDLQVGFRGLMGGIWLKDHRKKVKRGTIAVHSDNRRPGGRVYGYRKRYGEQNGLQDICPEQSAVVLRIFEQYAAERSAKAIAIGLNRDNIPSPRGGTWSASTVNGNRQRQNGLLENCQYIGQVTYDKSTKVRDRPPASA